MARQHQFRESLEETALPEMFASIYRHKVPGLFEVSNGENSKRIVISEGNVIHARSTDRSDRLGAHLYRLGKLSRKDLVETMRERESSDKRHGQLLIEHGLLSPSALYDGIQSQMRAIVWSVFSWKKGEVTFKIGEFSEPDMIKIHLPVRQVIVQGIKKVPDAKALVAKLGRKTTVMRPTYTTEDLIELALDSDEYALLRLVDGEKSLFDICTMGPYSVSENARLLYAYRVLHLIRAGDENGPGSGLKIRLKPEGSTETAP